MDEPLIFEGILETKEINMSDNPKAPAGFIYFKELDKKLTVWGKSVLDKLTESGEYKVVYSHKSNSFNGQTYDNYTVDDIIDKNIEIDTDKITFKPEYIAKQKEQGFPTENLKEGSGELVWSIMGYSVKINEEIREIEIPRKILDYLIKLKGAVGSDMEEKNESLE